MGVRRLHDVKFSPAKSKVASYRAAALRRERLGLLDKIKRHLDSVDPTELIARPIDADGWRRLVDRQIFLQRFKVSDDEEVPRIRLRKKSVEQTRAQRAIAFIEGFCRVPEGPRAGQRMQLDEFEKKFIRDVLDNPHGTHQAILSIAKKNGKSGLIAALLLVFLVGPEARFVNSQIVSGAMEREQAAIVFKYASKMAMGDPTLSGVVTSLASKRLLGLPRYIEFRALAAVAKSTQGISPFVAILDEIGQVKGPKSDFVDAIVTAQGAYDDALLLIISTQAAEDTDLLSTLIDQAQQEKDPHTVLHLYTADANCDLADEAQWLKANPGLGTIRSVTDMRKLAYRAEHLPSFASSFRNLNLNQRVATHEYFVPMDTWRENGSEPEPIDGASVYGGLDLAAVSDLCALVLVSEAGDVHSYFWLPEKGLAEKAKQDKNDYVLWKDEGFLFTTPGATVEYEHVAEFLRGVFDRCLVQKIRFDRQFMRFLRPWLVKAEFTDEELEKFEEYGQGFISMSPALRELESKLLNKKLRHGNNPILSMCAAHAVVEKDAAGSRKFNKAKATNRIDGMVALAMAVGAMPNIDEDSQVQFFIV